jgi:hypothetical protein
MNGNYHMEEITDEERAFRHSEWADKRAMVQGCLGSCGTGLNRYKNFVHCGAGAEVWCRKSDGSPTLLAYYCHDRFCWPCASSRSRTIARNLHGALNKRSHRFLTLTLRSSENRLDKEIDRLYSGFKTLRRDPWWQRVCSGGCSFLEVTLNDRTLRWHPHLHIIQEGGYVPQAMLQKKWHGITGDSHIVWIEAIKDAKETIRYVSKYASKPLDASVFHSMSTLSEVMTCMRGRRMCLTFGRWAGLKLTKVERTFDPDSFKRLGSLGDLLRHARAGEPYAVGIISHLKEHRSFIPRNPIECN